MKSIFQILHDLFKPTEEELQQAHERNLRQVLHALMSLRADGNEFPDLAEIAEKLREKENGMPFPTLREYCTEAKEKGYVQFLVGPTSLRITLSPNGLNHLWLPA